MSRRLLVVDLDGTLTVDDKAVGYPDKPLEETIAVAVAAAASQGFGVEIMTARGMRTWSNDRALVEQHVRPTAEDWLRRKGVPFEVLHVAKPWCGPRGFYVDDRNLHLEELVFRFGGPFATSRVEVVATPRGDVAAFHARLARIERWLEVTSYRYGLPGDRANWPTSLRDDALVDPPASSAPGGAVGLAGPTSTGTADLVLEIADVGRADPAPIFALHAERLTTERPSAWTWPGDGVVAGFTLRPAVRSEDRPRAGTSEGRGT